MVCDLNEVVQVAYKGLDDNTFLDEVEASVDTSQDAFVHRNKDVEVAFSMDTSDWVLVLRADNRIQEQLKDATELVIVTDGHNLVALGKVNLFSYAELEGTSFFRSTRITILGNVHQELGTLELPSSYGEGMDMGAFGHFLPYSDSFLFHSCCHKAMIHSQLSSSLHSDLHLQYPLQKLLCLVWQLLEYLPQPID